MKTHYRKVFKSDHLSSADIEEFIEEGRPTRFMIDRVQQEYKTLVAGKKIDANIMYFVEPIKPMVLNAVNSKVLRAMFNSPYIEDWKGKEIEVFINHAVQMKGETVQGLRLRKPMVATSGINETQISKEVSECKTVEDLEVVYNSDVRIKTNRFLCKLISDKKNELEKNS